MSFKEIVVFTVVVHFLFLFEVELVQYLQPVSHLWSVSFNPVFNFCVVCSFVFVVVSVPIACTGPVTVASIPQSL